MTIDNGGTKDNQGLLRFQGDLVYRGRIYLHRFSHLQSCKLLTSCGCRPWTGPDAVIRKQNHLVSLQLHQDRQKTNN